MKTRYLNIGFAYLLLSSMFQLGVYACCQGTPTSCYTCQGGVWVWKCSAEQSCCGSNCYNMATQKCCTDSYPYYLCGLNQTCCSGNCKTTCYRIALTEIYQGSCACYGVEGDGYGCFSNDAELRSLGIGKICQHVRTCVNAPTGVQGMTECVSTRGNVCDVWTCRDDVCWPGVILCWELNVLVCTVQCAAAAAACAQNPGGPECSQGLEDCFQCLTREGVECGCLVIQCGYNKCEGYVEGDTVGLSGCACVGN